MKLFTAIKERLSRLLGCQPCTPGTLPAEAQPVPRPQFEFISCEAQAGISKRGSTMRIDTSVALIGHKGVQVFAQPENTLQLQPGLPYKALTIRFANWGDAPAADCVLRICLADNWQPYAAQGSYPPDSDFELVLVYVPDAVVDTPLHLYLAYCGPDGTPYTQDFELLLRPIDGLAERQRQTASTTLR